MLTEPLFFQNPYALGWALVSAQVEATLAQTEIEAALAAWSRPVRIRIEPV